MSVLRIALSQPVRALRLYRTKDREDPLAGSEHQLFGLQEKQRQDAADREALLSCIGSIEQQLGDIPAHVTDNLGQVAALATEIGLAVAREVVGAAADRGLVDTTAVVKRCLDHAVGGAEPGHIHIQLSPDDLSTVLGCLGSDSSMRERMQQVEFGPDPSLPRGHVRVQSGSGRLVYDPQEVLTRISDEVRKVAMEETRGDAS